MAPLLYASNMSLDGFTEDAHGAFDWAPPDDDVFVSITEVMRSAGTYLYGRRMYETMAVWETDPALAARSPLTAEYARVWQSARKVVHSTTLAVASTADTTIVDRFDPEAVRAMKHAADRPLLVGGPHLAAHALAAGLVGEVVLYVWPVVLGGRNPALPRDLRVDLALVDLHRFANGVVRLHYCVR